MISPNTLQELEGILAIRLMTSITWEVQLHILLGQFDGFRRTVYTVYEFGTTTHGIERETTRIAEHIQDALTLRIMLQQRAVLTLVDKESRLLAFQPVYAELQTILSSDIIVRTAYQESVHIISCHKRQRSLALIVNM